ncbi:MAG: hypothetical protein ACRYGM_20285, partial [Janthinobacterium lividum]
SFVVHDAPAVTPSAIPQVPAVPDAVPAPTPGALDAAIERLRAAKDTAVVPVDPSAVPVDPTAVPVVPAVPVVVPAPVPVVPPPVWTATTSQGARWRAGRDSLVIDMGGGRQAVVHVDPAFLALPQDAANSRIDFLKQTILETFPGSTTQFRFARDGSVSALR